MWFFYIPQYWNVSSQGGVFYTCAYYADQGLDGVPAGERPAAYGEAVKANPANCLWKSCLACDTATLEEPDGAVTTTLCQLNFPRCFGTSAFFIFMLGGIAGWISFRLREIIEKML